MLIGISLVRNEQDIIEAMLRHNIRFLDKIVVIDNGSDDHTPSIVQQLIDEGLNLELKFDGSKGFPQNKILTDNMRKAPRDYGAQRVFFLDGDEFLRGDPDRFRTAVSKSTRLISLPWTTYVPTESDDLSEQNPIKRITYRRKKELPTYTKISVPDHLCETAEVAMGSHSVAVNGRGRAGSSIRGIGLSHFPVRSTDQIIAKILTGWWSIRMRGPGKSEAYHWKELAERFTNAPELSIAELSEIANTYAAKRPVKLIADPIECSFDLRYTPQLQSGDLARRLISFTDELVDGLAEN